MSRLKGAQSSAICSKRSMAKCYSLLVVSLKIVVRSNFNEWCGSTDTSGSFEVSFKYSLLSGKSLLETYRSAYTLQPY